MGGTDEVFGVYGPLLATFVNIRQRLCRVEPVSLLAASCVPIVQCITALPVVHMVGNGKGKCQVSEFSTFVNYCMSVWPEYCKL